MAKMKTRSGAPDYPEWVPASLHDDVTSQVFAKFHPEIYTRLTTEPEMEKVWRTLTRRAREDTYAHDFMERVLHNLKPNDPETLAGMPRSQAVNHSRKIAINAGQLIDLLRAVKLHEWQPAALVDGALLHGALKKTITSMVRQGVVRLADHIQPRHVASVLTSDLWSAKLGGIEAVLKKIALRTQRIAQIAPRPKKPHEATAPRVFFINQLSGYFRKAYGTPLHEQVAITANVVFQPSEPLTAARIAQLVKKRG